MDNIIMDSAVCFLFPMRMLWCRYLYLIIDAVEFRLSICKHTARMSSCCSHQTTMLCRNKVWSFIYTIGSTLYRLSMLPKIWAKMLFLSFSPISLQGNLMVPGRCAEWVVHNHAHWYTVLSHSISLLLLLQVFNSHITWEFSRVA